MSHKPTPEQALRYAARHSRSYAQRREAHLCVQCGAQDARTLSGKCMCEKCAMTLGRRQHTQHRRTYQRDTYQMLKAHHYCVSCRKQDAFTLAGRAHCAECNERANENRRKMLRNTDALKQRNKWNREWRKKMISERRCVECGRKLPFVWDKRRCPNCNAAMNQKALDKARAAGVRSREDAVSAGLCAICCKKPALPEKKMCQECYAVACRNVAKARQARGKDHPWRKIPFGNPENQKGGDAT